MPHRFATREERLEPPVCGLISDSAWSEIFANGRHLPELPHLFNGTLEQLLAQGLGDLSSKEKKSVLFILLLRFPEAEIIQDYAQNTLKLSNADLVECLATLGQLDRLKMLNKPQHHGLAFKTAARHGHLNVLNWLAEQVGPSTLRKIICSRGVLKWLAEQVAPNELQAMIDSENYEAFRWAARHGHLEVLKWLKQVAPNELQAMIDSEDYEAFRWAAENGHLEVLKWLSEQVASDELQAMIDSVDYYAFRRAASYGHLEILKWLKQVAPDELQAMIDSVDYYAFRWAARHGHLEILKWLSEQVASDELQAMIDSEDYDAFRWAASNGHLEVLKWLSEQVAPDELQAMIDSEDYEAFRWAASNGRLEVLKWLSEQVAPNKLQAMIDSENYEAFRWAAENGHLEVLKWLSEQVAPDELQAMIDSEDYEAFRRAAMNGHTEVVNWLLDEPSCFAYVESHVRESVNTVGVFTSTTLSSLRSKKEQFELEHPNGVFDISDERESRLCFYLMRSLIRRNERSLDEGLVFLLSLPAVRALVHQEITPGQSNELLRLALRVNNPRAANLLLNIPAVRALAEQHNYYAEEQQGQLDLRALAQDRESSMIALNQQEKERFHGLINHYEKIVITKTVSVLMEELRASLISRYEAHPARITLKDGSEQVLPVSWEAFTDLALDELEYEAALKAYHQHIDHTVWRYLSKPNPWMHPHAGYVNVNPNNTQERWSTFEEYQTLIVTLWLAAKDESSIPTDDFTLEGRIEEFFRALALIGRAHNWDKTRPRQDGKGREEYDDGEGDRPSCFSGVKRRLSEAVKGHVLLQGLNERILNLELRDFARAHFAQVLEHHPEKRKAFIDAFDEAMMDEKTTYIDVLKPFNLSESKQNKWFEELIGKYGIALNDSMVSSLKDRLILSHEEPLKAYHALTLEGLTQFFQNLLPVENLSNLPEERIDEEPNLNPSLEDLNRWAEENPDQLEAMIGFNDYAVLRKAYQRGLFDVLTWLLHYPSCFAYAEQHSEEYGNEVLGFIDNYLDRLRAALGQFLSEHPNGVFDLDSQSAKLCGYMVRHLIRLNDSNSDDKLALFLSIPAVKALVHQDSKINILDKIERHRLTFFTPPKEQNEDNDPEDNVNLTLK